MTATPEQDRPDRIAEIKQRYASNNDTRGDFAWLIDEAEALRFALLKNAEIWEQAAERNSADAASIRRAHPGESGRLRGRAEVFTHTAGSLRKLAARFGDPTSALPATPDRGGEK